MFSKMFHDLRHSNSADSAPLTTPPELLQGFTVEEVIGFLRQVYTVGQLPISSAQQAYSLFRPADLFDSPTLTAKCRQYLEHPLAFFSITQAAAAGENGVVKWLLVAQQYNLSELEMKCIKAIAHKYNFVKDDPRMLQVKQSNLFAILNEHECILQRRKGGALHLPTKGTGYPVPHQCVLYCHHTDCAGHPLTLCQQPYGQSFQQTCDDTVFEQRRTDDDDDY